jgi:hypothetical protein
LAAVHIEVAIASVRVDMAHIALDADRGKVHMSSGKLAQATESLARLAATPICIAQT